MATENQIHDVAIIGATGNLGSIILSSLLSKNRFSITAITRESSNTSLPTHPSLHVHHGSYDDMEFMSSALANNDILIIALGFMTSIETQFKILGAAAKAGIKWIIPTEFGSDNANPKIRDTVAMNAAKTPIREKIESLGMKWIGVATNPWFDYSLKGGFFGIDVPNRKATIYNGGNTKFNTTNMATVGKAVASLLSLPKTAEGKPSLSEYANKFIYISSFLTSQREILSAVQHVTKTPVSDWTVEEGSAERWIEEGKERMAKGDFYGAVNTLYGQLFIEGSGSNYQNKVANEVLGLPKEDLEGSVRAALA